MRKFGLIGFPLSHSFSQKYFSEKFKREGIGDAAYSNYPISSIDDLDRLLAAEPGLEGLNVTIPYKQAVISRLDTQDELVLQTGACNCIRLHQGRLQGYNTDVIGFEKSLQKGLRSKPLGALILGSGGGSKAVEYALRRMGISVLIVTRNPKGQPDQISYGDLTPGLIRSHTLIINTTPLGMYPDTEGLPPIDYQAITPEHFLFDLIYNPEKSGFLKNGEGRGAGIRNGLEMLQIQAEESWVIWNR
jgi:shikimate dehydrogenase